MKPRSRGAHIASPSFSSYDPNDRTAKITASTMIHARKQPPGASSVYIAIQAIRKSVQTSSSRFIIAGHTVERAADFLCAPGVTETVNRLGYGQTPPG